MFERKAKQLCCHLQVNNAAKLFCYWTELSICKVSYRIDPSKPVLKKTKNDKDTFKNNLTMLKWVRRVKRLTSSYKISHGDNVQHGDHS